MEDKTSKENQKKETKKDVCSQDKEIQDFIHKMSLPKEQFQFLTIETEDGTITRVKDKDYISPEEYKQLKVDYELYQKIKEKGRGYIFEDYKTLCKELDLKVKTGKSRQMQLEDLERFCCLKKVQGKKNIKITMIRKNVKQKVNKREGLYVNLIEALLLWNFQKMDKDPEKYIETATDNLPYVKEFTKSNLFLMLGMINENFLFKNRKDVIQNTIKELINKEQENKRRIAEETNTTFTELTKEEIEALKIEKTKEIQAFLLRVNTVLTNILNNSLKSLEKRLAINYEKIINIITEDGEKYEASRAERRRMDDYKLKVLKGMGYNIGIKNIFFLPEKKREEFDRKYNEIILREEGWQYTYAAYKINHTQKYLQEMINRVEKDLDQKLKRNKLSLNKKVIEAVDKGEEKEKLKQEERSKQQKENIAGKRVIQTANPNYIKVVQKSFPMKIELQKKYEPYGEDFIETHKQYAKTFLEINEIEYNKDFIYKQKDIKELAEDYGLEDCIMTKEVTEEEIADILFSGMFEEEGDDKK